LQLNNDAIVEFLNTLDNESKALKREALRISWYMRGGVPYDHAILLSAEERLMAKQIIEENLEITKESGLPFF